jgi:hypothetical protein
VAAQTVRVTGLRETLRAFAVMGGVVQEEVRRGLFNAAMPVAGDARNRISRYPGAITETITPIITRKGAIVRQRQAKRGGTHPNFGGLQMGHLLGALEDRQAEVISRVERTLDNLTREVGF